MAIAIPSPPPQTTVTAPDTAVQADLRNAATAQEVVYAESQRYTESVAFLRANGFAPTSGAQFQVTADARGYCVSAFRPGETTYQIDSDESGPAPGPCREQVL